MSRMVGGTFGVAAIGALFQHLARNELAERARRHRRERGDARAHRREPGLRQRRRRCRPRPPRRRTTRSSTRSRPACGWRRAWRRSACWSRCSRSTRSRRAAPGVQAEAAAEVPPARRAGRNDGRAQRAADGVAKVRTCHGARSPVAACSRAPPRPASAAWPPAATGPRGPSRSRTVSPGAHEGSTLLGSHGGQQATVLTGANVRSGTSVVIDVDRVLHRRRLRHRLAAPAGRGRLRREPGPQHPHHPSPPGPQRRPAATSPGSPGRPTAARTAPAAGSTSTVPPGRRRTSGATSS